MPDRGAAGTRKSSANSEKLWGVRVSRARRDYVVYIKDTLSVDSEVLKNDAMNPACNRYCGRRGVKLVPGGGELFFQERGVSCA